jgi:hypothetical protein
LRNIQRGSRAPEVQAAQHLFNIAIGNDLSFTALDVDQVFGPQTEAQIRRFQERRHLVADGAVGHATWRALGLRVDVEQHIRLVPQYTPMSCWSACAAMALRQLTSLGAGGANIETLPAQFGALRHNLPNLETFASSIGYRVTSPPAWGSGFAQHLRTAPVILAGQFQGIGGHIVVVSAVWGDGHQTGDGTILRVHNPLPIGVGAIEATLYPDMTLGTRVYRPEYMLVR